MKRAILAISLLALAAPVLPSAAAPCPAKFQSGAALSATVHAEFSTACPEYVRAPGTREMPAAAFGDEFGIVAWRDRRSEPTRIVATRVTDRNGVRDPGGIWLPAEAEQTEPDVEWNGETWLVAWTEAGSAAPEVRASRIDVGGNVMDAPSIPVSGAGGSAPAVARLGDGWIVAWRTPEAIRAARLDEFATVLDAGGVAVSGPCATCSAPRVATNDTAAVISWRDGDDVFTAPFDVAGTQAANKIAGTAKRGYALAEYGRGFLAAWGTTDGVRARRLARGGTPTGDRIRVSSRGGAPVLATADGETSVGWRVRDGDGRTLRLATVSSAGLLDVRDAAIGDKLADVDLTASRRAPFAAWADGGAVRASTLRRKGPLNVAGRNLSLGAQAQDDAAIAHGGSRYLVAWRDEGDSLRIASVSPSGGEYVAGATTLLTDTADVPTAPAVGWNGGRFLVAWSDGDILAVRVTADGEVLDDEPIEVSRSGARDTQPSVASDGGDFLVSWTVRGGEEGNDDVRAARVSGAGEVRGRPALEVAAGDVDERASSVAASGDGYLVAWEETPAGEADGDTDVRAAFVSNGGEVAEEAVAIAEGATAAWQPWVTPSDDGFLVTWGELVPPTHLLPIPLPTEETEPHFEVRAAFLDAAGALASDGRFMVARTEARPVMPRSAPTGIGFLIAWSSETDGTPISGLRITDAGNLIDDAPFTIAPATVNGVPLMATAPGDAATVGYVRTAFEAPWASRARVFVRRVDGS